MQTVRIKPRLVLTVAICAALVLPASAAAATMPVSLRVVGSDGKTLAEQTQYTGTVKFKADPKASCFGPGSTSNVHKLTGATALGQLINAAKVNRTLSPVSVTDASAFGLGVCGIGGQFAPDTGFWYLKYNHSASQVGADQLVIGAGDEVLWYLDSDFSDAPPGELFLNAPSRARPGTKFKAKVLSYADDGARTPVARASVTGAAEPTDANGKTTVSFPNAGPRSVQATLPGSIPSNIVNLCLEVDLSSCAPKPGATIFGSARIDAISGTRGDDSISAASGNDRIDISSGGDDTVLCGRGRDRVTGAEPGDHIAKSCEKGRV